MNLAVHSANMLSQYTTISAYLKQLHINPKITHTLSKYAYMKVNIFKEKQKTKKTPHPLKTLYTNNTT